MYCARERQAAETCLGSCLDPELGQKYKECTNLAKQQPGGHDCSGIAKQLVQARMQASKNTLLAMGFAETDFTPQEPSDAVMDMVNMVVFTSIVEDSSQL